MKVIQEGLEVYVWLSEVDPYDGAFEATHPENYMHLGYKDRHRPNGYLVKCVCTGPLCAMSLSLTLSVNPKQKERRCPNLPGNHMY